MDHLAAPAAPEHDTLEGWTLAAALATRTSTIRLGHLVTANPFRHPAFLAKMAATVDVISDGRLELGLGWGSVEEELVTYGFGAAPPRVRAEQLGEAIEVIELMFGGEPFDFDGDHFQLKGADRPARGRWRGGCPCTSAAPAGGSPCRSWPGTPTGGTAPPMPSTGWTSSARSRARRACRCSTRSACAVVRGTRRGGAAHQAALRCVGRDRERHPRRGVAALATERAAGVELFILQFHDFATPETLSFFAREVMPNV